jgi:hypothetical protein
MPVSESIFENDGFAVFSIATVSMEFIWGDLSKTVSVLPAHLRLRCGVRKNVATAILSATCAAQKRVAILQRFKSNCLRAARNRATNCRLILVRPHGHETANRARDFLDAARVLSRLLPKS